MWAAARWFATRRRAAFTVATLLLVPSSSLASDKASSSRSTTVLDIRSSQIVMSATDLIVYQIAADPFQASTADLEYYTRWLLGEIHAGLQRGAQVCVCGREPTGTSTGTTAVGASHARRRTLGRVLRFGQNAWRMTP
jgi:hypothetical protein